MKTTKATIDLDQLSLRLAELWFEETYIRDYKYNEIYDVTLHEGHGLYTMEEVKEPHASTFWNRVQFYKELIDTYEITEKESTE